MRQFGFLLPGREFLEWIGFRSGYRSALRLLATAVTVVAGVPLAWLLARRRFPGRDLISAAVLSPLVLPPTVFGYYLLMLIGSRGVIGRMLAAWNIELAFTWRAAVLAAAVGSFPLLIKTAQSGFESVDRRLEQAARNARTLGVEHLLDDLGAARMARHPGGHACWPSAGPSAISASH